MLTPQSFNIDALLLYNKQAIFTSPKMCFKVFVYVLGEGRQAQDLIKNPHLVVMTFYFLSLKQFLHLFSL